MWEDGRRGFRWVRYVLAIKKAVGRLREGFRGRVIQAFQSVGKSFPDDAGPIIRSVLHLASSNLGATRRKHSYHEIPHRLAITPTSILPLGSLTPFSTVPFSSSFTSGDLKGFARDIYSTAFHCGHPCLSKCKGSSQCHYSRERAHFLCSREWGGVSSSDARVKCS